jgi:hypothetical protein
MKKWWRIVRISAVGILLAGSLSTAPAFALGSQQNPQSSSTGLEGTVAGPPPSSPATISIPVNGQTVSNTPITVSGLCKTDLLVKIFSNNVFVGSTICKNGSYSLQVDLFSGANDLIARIYDALDQAGPDSNVVRVTFNDAQFAQFGTRITLTSIYARKGAAPGQTLTWPIALSGGLGPYAVSVDWGDGKGATLLSKPFADSFDVTHIYDNAGVYSVVIKATDANGVTAFLQLVGVGTGQVTGKTGTGTSGGGTTTTTKSQIIWIPLLVIIPLLVVAFWLGRRHELFTIRKRLEENRM